MEGSYADKFSFTGEWYDSQASLLRRFYIFFYPVDDTVSIYDVKARKNFMRRVKVNGVNLSSFFLGATIYIHGRLFKITDFANKDTKNRLEKNMEVTFAMLKPIPMSIAGKILTHFHNHGLFVTKMKKSQLTSEDIGMLYQGYTTDPSFPFVLEHLEGQACIGMEVVGKNSIEVLKKVVGDKDPLVAEPGTIRALYGSDRVRNCLHIAISQDEAAHLLSYFFPPSNVNRLHLTATLSNCTLCIVKPSAIREGKLGGIMQAIDEGGFDITALNMIIVECVNAGEFYEVYKGIVAEYKGMVEELASGSCVAMEIVAKNTSVNTAVEFRKLVGPVDPEIARMLRPNTIRAKFGTNKVKNAVHCSDLPEDGLLEVEYFFKILAL